MASEVFLRDVKESDLPIFFDQQLDPEATRMAAFPSGDREAFMAHWTKSMADKTATLQTIISDGSVAGNIVCWQQSDERLVGYWLEGILGQGRCERSIVIVSRSCDDPSAHCASRSTISRLFESCRNVGSRFPRYVFFPERRVWRRIHFYDWNR